MEPFEWHGICSQPKIQKKFSKVLTREKPIMYNTFNTRGDGKNGYAEQSRRVGRVPVWFG
jgi:hypothetical protein